MKKKTATVSHYYNSNRFNRIQMNSNKNLEQSRESIQINSNQFKFIEIYSPTDNVKPIEQSL